MSSIINSTRNRHSEQLKGRIEGFTDSENHYDERKSDRDSAKDGNVLRRQLRRTLVPQSRSLTEPRTGARLSPQRGASLSLLNVDVSEESGRASQDAAALSETASSQSEARQESADEPNNAPVTQFLHRAAPLISPFTSQFAGQMPRKKDEPAAIGAARQLLEMRPQPCQDQRPSSTMVKAMAMEEGQKDASPQNNSSVHHWINGVLQESVPNSNSKRGDSEIVMHAKCACITIKKCLTKIKKLIEKTCKFVDRLDAYCREIKKCESAATAEVFLKDARRALIEISRWVDSFEALEREAMDQIFAIETFDRCAIPPAILSDATSSKETLKELRKTSEKSIRNAVNMYKALKQECDEIKKRDVFSSEMGSPGTAAAVIGDLYSCVCSTECGFVCQISIAPS